MGKAKKGGGAKDKKAAGPKVKKPGHKYASAYEVSGNTLTRKNKSCPKCGTGVFLAGHKDRLTCGKCGYMERKAKKE